MITQRLYYTDAYRTRFSARVARHAQTAGSPALVLDQTAFYPTSGGQPYDTGTLGGLAVVDVVAQDEEILHVLGSTDAEFTDAARRPPVGAIVEGEIDWPRRFDHMQQHTGQHLISQLFAQRFGCETVAVHFGAEESTVDLDTPELSAEQLALAEREANRIVYAALPVLAYSVSEQELPKLPLRRPPKVQGEIRIVEIQAWDYSACGGTHCGTTAEVGVIKFLRQERRKATTRVTFVCGGRAYADYALRHALLGEIAGLYSADVRRTPELTANLLAQNGQLVRDMQELTAQLAVHEAARLLAQGERTGAVTLVAHVLDGYSAERLKALAAEIRRTSGAIAILAGAADEKSTFIMARADDVALHAGQMLRAVLAEFAGAGGGRPEYAQGGGVAAERLAALVAESARRVRNVITGDSAK